MDRGLGQHGVVLELRLAQRRSVSGNDDQLGLASTEGLEGGLVTEGDLSTLHTKFAKSQFVGLHVFAGRISYTSASLLERELASFLFFLMGAIVTTGGAGRLSRWWFVWSLGVGGRSVKPCFSRCCEFDFDLPGSLSPPK